MKRDLLRDENAVSVSVGFILTFTITVLIFVTTMNSFHDLTESTEHNVMSEQCEIHGNDIALQLSNLDMKINTTSKAGGQVGELSLELDLPDSIAGQYYSVEFSNQSKEIIFRSQKSDRVLTKIGYVTEASDVASTTIYSSMNDHYLTYDPQKNLIEVY